MPLRLVVRTDCLVHGRQVLDVGFAPCNSVLAGGELHWQQEGTQLKLAGSELCLVPEGAAWLRWLVPQRLALASCAVSLHQWASLDPLCDLHGTCYGRLGSRPHPLPVRDRQYTLVGRQVGSPWLALAALIFALVALLVTLVPRARARWRVPFAPACKVATYAPTAERAIDGATAPATPTAAAADGALPVAVDRAGSPAGSASPAPSASAIAGLTAAFTPGALDARALAPHALSPIDESSAHHEPPGDGIASPLSERTNELANTGGSAYKIWKAPRPPGASDSSSSDNSSIARPEHDENAHDGNARPTRAAKGDGYIVMRAPKPPLSLRPSGKALSDVASAVRLAGKPSKKKAAPGTPADREAPSTSEQLMRAVANAVEILSPSRCATRIGASGMPLTLTQHAQAAAAGAAFDEPFARMSTGSKPATPAQRARPMTRESIAGSELTSSDEDEAAPGAATGAGASTPYEFGLKSKLQESLLERQIRIHRPIAPDKSRCAACLVQFKKMQQESPRLVYVECAGRCGRVWHPKCQPAGDKTRPRTFVCADCRRAGC
ncbi:hypothetical protein KFE25_001113 [Diacronema lutheri]|uniref:Uncharacterized protein n=1 Tax=Diacronema lutheri TaxID=2081491 RepID=A0A8J5XJ37_DIALT|nr:hypothetical protein KFE25_001113 [Diacronema lutheri]